VKGSPFALPRLRAAAKLDLRKEREEEEEEEGGGGRRWIKGAERATVARDACRTVFKP
jgi:hypothetical protein